ncbi:TPA: hypothetical protein J5F84_002616 [Escherichia coli]|nr:hypothetical protein [Escherichia coli]
MSMPLLARVQANVPVWAHEQLAAWDAAEFAAMSDFITEHYWTGQGSINVYCIVGTDHPQYAGMTWLELLERGNAADAWREVVVLQRRLEALSASPEKNLPRSWWLRLLQRGTRS